MPDYKKMYALLCAAASEALDLLPETEETRPGRDALQTALLEAEEMYISAGDTAEESDFIDDKDIDWDHLSSYAQ